MNYKGIDLTSDIIVITGPTASGKTSLSIEIAKILNCDIINADAYQVFRKMDIGTNKTTLKEMDGVKHYLIDYLDYKEEFNVKIFQREARKIIDEKLAKNEKIIICGGSGLYVNALLYHYDFEDNVEFDNLKQKYEAYTLEQLQELVSDKNLNSSDFSNHKRLVNVAIKKELNIDLIKNEKVKHYPNFQIIYIAVEREKLYNVINERVDVMFELGLVEEVKMFDKNYNSQLAIGYKEVHKYLNDEITLADAVELVKKNTRNFAKRQNTWFNNQMDVNTYMLKGDTWQLIKN